MPTPTAPLPLPVIKVAEPCHVPWASMDGDERKRFCDHCSRDVHDLSAMRDVEVNDLICASAGNLCVRFEQAADGSVRTLDYQQRSERERRTRRWLLVTAVASVVAGVGNLVWQRRQKKQVWVQLQGSML